MGLEQISFATRDEQKQELTARLIAAGALGVEERGSVLIVYASDGAEKQRFLLAAASLDEGLLGAERLRVESIDGDYEKVWLNALEPIQITENLVLRPTSRTPALPNETTLWYQPDVSFGSGEHATTQLAARLIEELGQSIPGERLLDVGAGNGVLMLVALSSGFASALGLDVDPVSVAAARKNLELNGLAANAEVRRGSADSVTESFPIVCANIISSVQQQIGRDLVARTLPGGRLLVTGILESEREELRDFFQGLGVVLLERRAREGWCLLHFERPA